MPYGRYKRVMVHPLAEPMLVILFQTPLDWNRACRCRHFLSSTPRHRWMGQLHLTGALLCLQQCRPHLKARTLMPCSSRTIPAMMRWRREQPAARAGTRMLCRGSLVGHGWLRWALRVGLMRRCWVVIPRSLLRSVHLPSGSPCCPRTTPWLRSQRHRSHEVATTTALWLWSSVLVLVLVLLLLLLLLLVLVLVLVLAVLLVLVNVPVLV